MAVGTKSCGKEDDHGRVGNGKLLTSTQHPRYSPIVSLNIVPFRVRNPRVTSKIDDRVLEPVFASCRRIVVPRSTGCRSEEGLKETAVMEETATRMVSPTSFSHNPEP